MLPTGRSLSPPAAIASVPDRGRRGRDGGQNMFPRLLRVPHVATCNIPEGSRGCTDCQDRLLPSADHPYLYWVDTGSKRKRQEFASYSSTVAVMWRLSPTFTVSGMLAPVSFRS